MTLGRSLNLSHQRSGDGQASPAELCLLTAQSKR